MSYSREGRSTSPPQSRSPSNRGRRSRSLSKSRGRSRSRSRDSGDTCNPGNNLYVTGLSPRVTTSDLENYFGNEGKLAASTTAAVEIPCGPTVELAITMKNPLSRFIQTCLCCEKLPNNWVLMNATWTHSNPSQTQPINGSCFTLTRPVPSSKWVSWSGSTQTHLNLDHIQLILSILSEISFSKTTFEFCLQVLECHLVADPRSRESRGFGFVTMETVEDADRCIKYLNRSVLEGRLITVAKVLISLRWMFIITVMRSSDFYSSSETLPNSFWQQDMVADGPVVIHLVDGKREILTQEIGEDDLVLHMGGEQKSILTLIRGSLRGAGIVPCQLAAVAILEPVKLNPRQSSPTTNIMCIN
ncbi:hypothetical protein HHK36_000184 [Tetracentron sinense]|uniref:RRM domain-containing protein n=1 Tax=Tetracentron sinense TaxID=13715 RepID=A0A834ZR64_TETSI|nr:hypothetical protein HHK36_000184 [Tetracentron sinense]